ncbi:2-dehydropantoate 2-reductase [Anoxybacillus vitaminiphilus]|uniref:2-dehydropantoate 2-reductase n=1 Tax=Paranoxybacillus vitaminiphilus TaxID=581036 RepID=A0A327YRT9_9BACL|nr:2-dehydropantoate 2-reductase [Anoxybacillus vitaminiphilus]RAK23261.1 2-dehydropantoate 2-reductase [Anoxybacillus vitaminiphilus]
MKVGIVGGGAVGLLIAAYLHRMYDITLYTRRQSQAALLNKNGLCFIKGSKEKTFFIKTKHIEQSEMNEDVVFVTVKQYDLPELASSANRLQNIPTVVFLQNGMGHLPLLSRFNNRNIVLGVVEHGALKHDDRTVEHTGEGKISLAVWKGEIGEAQRLIEQSSSHFPFLFKKDWYEMLAMKLAINAVVNPLTALLRVKNGQLLEVNEYRMMMQLLFSELKDVLSLPNEQKAWENIVLVCEKTANNRSSMLKDIEQGRQTEIDAILGYIIQRGKSMNIQTPLCEFLLHAIKGMERRGKFE